MMELLIAVMTASLLGSIHCVGMCGPFVVLATGDRGRSAPGHEQDGGASDVSSGLASTGQSSNSWTQRCMRLCSYHLGRLTTYLILGAIVGAIGAAVDGVAGWWGIAAMAARALGAAMVVMGVVRLWRWMFHRRAPIAHSGWWQGWTQGLIGLRKRFSGRSPIGSAYSWGLISTWLPCGWLYVFAMAAATTGSIRASVLLMAAFWVGTLPLLSGLALGAHASGVSLQRWFQPIAAMVLIAFGCYTCIARSAVDLSTLSDSVQGALTVRQVGGDLDGSSALDAAGLKKLTESKLPCCESDSASAANGEAESQPVMEEDCPHCRTRAAESDSALKE